MSDEESFEGCPDCGLDTVEQREDKYGSYEVCSNCGWRE